MDSPRFRATLPPLLKPLMAMRCGSRSMGGGVDWGVVWRELVFDEDGEERLEEGLLPLFDFFAAFASLRASLRWSLWSVAQFSMTFARTALLSAIPAFELGSRTARRTSSASSMAAGN